MYYHHSERFSFYISFCYLAQLLFVKHGVWDPKEGADRLIKKPYHTPSTTVPHGPQPRRTGWAWEMQSQFPLNYMLSTLINTKPTALHPSGLLPHRLVDIPLEGKKLSCTLVQNILLKCIVLLCGEVESACQQKHFNSCDGFHQNAETVFLHRHLFKKVRFWPALLACSSEREIPGGSTTKIALIHLIRHP